MRRKIPSTAALVAFESAARHQSFTRAAETKMKDMNANDVEAAVRMLAGSARSMGLTVVEG